MFRNAIVERPQEDTKRGVSITAKEVDKSIPTVKEFPPNVDGGKNWVGALQEKCQKLKLEGPGYDDCKIESNSQFMVTCSVSFPTISKGINIRKITDEKPKNARN